MDGLFEIGEGSVYRVTFQQPPVVELYRRLQLPLPMPLRLQGGSIQWEIVARADKFRQILAFAHRADPHARVLSLRREGLRDHLPQLSEAQRALLSFAMAEGYFSPRSAPRLAELAKKVGRRTSTVSEQLDLIERRLIESALAPNSINPDPRRRRPTSRPRSRVRPKVP